MLSQQHATDVGKAAHLAQVDAAELPGGAMLGHYRIDGVLGRGGIGIVYRATDTRLGRSVAIKFLSSTVADAEVTRRFRQEAKTASSLNHPHIVAVYDVGEHDGREYIVSELVDGGTLDDWATGARRRSWRQGVELLTGIADALAAAHSAGVLHRDIKPGNILIGSNGYAKLADFGLAKLVDSTTGGGGGGSSAAHATAAGIVVGTVAYMSPEQTAGHPLDARSDVFSFGIVLYELLAGRRPFEAANDLGVLKAIAHATPEPLPDDVPEFLQIVVEKSLEKDPSDRYQSMQDLVVDLRRAARKPTSSRLAVPSSDVRVVAGVVSRHPAATFAAVAAIVLAAAGATYVALSRPAPSRATASSVAPRRYEITQLTTSGIAISPAISPDGRFVAYVEMQRTRDALTSSLWIRQLATPSNQQIVAPEPGVEIQVPTVTPDGEFVDFLSGGGFLAKHALLRVAFLGGGATRLVDDVASAAGFSPDKGHLAFVRVGVGQSTTLIVADEDGSREREVARRAWPATFQTIYQTTRPNGRPAWSPDGHVIALFEQVPDRLQARVVFVDVASGNETKILDSHGVAPLGLAWLDSDSLVMSQSKTIGQPVQLWRMSYSDGEVSPLTNDLDSYVGVDVDAARTSLVTSRRETRISVWVGDERGAGSMQIVPSTGARSIVGLRFAGTRVLYDAQASGHVSVMAASLSGGAPEEIVPNAYTPSATRSGDTVIFARSDATGLWKVSATNGQPVALVPENGTLPFVTPDDRYVVFLSRRGPQVPWIVPIEGGEPHQIIDAYAGAATGFDIAPDGRRLLFRSKNEKDDNMVVVCDLPDCANRQDIDLPPGITIGQQVPLRWTPDGERLAYVGSGGSDIWTMSLDGAEAHEITHFGDHAPPGDIVNFAWSRDGSRLAIVRMTTSNDIVLLRLKP